VNFFADRNLARTLIKMLDVYDQDHTLVRLDDDIRFNPRSTDIEIIKALSSQTPRPVLLTADLYRVPAERKALKESYLTVVFFRSGFHEQDFHTQAVKVLSIWPEIVQQVTRCKEPTIFEIKPVAKKVDRFCKTVDLPSA